MTRPGQSEKAQASDLQLLEGLITYKVMRLADTILRAANQVYRERYDVTITELRILATIGAHQPLPGNEVSRLTRIDKAWVSRSSAALIRRGMVVRRPHPTDSRTILLSLTPKGRSLVRRIVPFSTARHDRLLAPISASDRTHLNALLETLQAQADDLLANPDRGSHRRFDRTASVHMPSAPPDKA